MVSFCFSAQARLSISIHQILKSEGALRAPKPRCCWQSGCCCCFEGAPIPLSGVNMWAARLSPTYPLTPEGSPGPWPRILYLCESKGRLLTSWTIIREFLESCQRGPGGSFAYKKCTLKSFSVLRLQCFEVLFKYNGDANWYLVSVLIHNSNINNPMYVYKYW